MKTRIVVIVAAVILAAVFVSAQSSYVAVPSGVTIGTIDKLALDDSIVDINTWIAQAVAGKINGCRERMIATWYPYLLNDTGITSIPRSKDELITLIASRSWYQNRATRDSIEAASRPQ